MLLINHEETIFGITRIRQYLNANFNNMGRVFKVILSDNSQSYMDKLESALGRSGKVEIISMVSDEKGMIKLLKNTPVDAVIINISNKEFDGVKAIKEVAGQFPEINVIALADTDDAALYYQILYAGAKGYILKSAGIEEVENAIIRVCTNSCYFSENLLSKILKDSESYPEYPGIQKINSEEKNTLNLISRNNSDEEIATELNSKVSQIRAIRKNLLKKTGCNNSASLVMFAIKSNIIKLKAS